MVIADVKKIDEILDRGTIVEILPTKKEFRDKLLGGQKLRFYIGFDATAPNLHLSHAKNFMLMEKLRQLGHEIIILFGDFTARIGDPTGESATRKQLSREDVLNNVSKWKELVRPLMAFDDKENPPKIMYNNDWLAPLSLEDTLNLASNVTVQQMIERDMFQKRLKEGKPIHLHEFLYPLMQGYDSVAMDVDVEVCGTDQTFNALVGRTLLKKLKNKDKFVVAVTLMGNPKTGELMSKSKGIGVFLDSVANDMFGQIMSQPDEMIEILFVNNTNLPLGEIDKIIKENGPRDSKMILASEIVSIFHGKESAAEAKENFINTFSKGGVPDDILEIKTVSGIELREILLEQGLVESKSDFRRLINEGAITYNGVVLEDPFYKITKGGVVKVGKKRFLKISL